MGNIMHMVKMVSINYFEFSFSFIILDLLLIHNFLGLQLWCCMSEIFFGHSTLAKKKKLYILIITYMYILSEMRRMRKCEAGLEHVIILVMFRQ